jgi:hypothetical protein
MPYKRPSWITVNLEVLSFLFWGLGLVLGSVSLMLVAGAILFSAGLREIAISKRRE